MATPRAIASPLKSFPQRPATGGRGLGCRFAAGLLLGVALLCGCPPQVVRNPEASQKRYLLAAEYFSKGAVPSAQEELRQAIALDDRNVEAYYLSGLLSLREVAELAPYRDLTLPLVLCSARSSQGIEQLR